jgi:purine-binding chemotaxis protein CheW
MSEDKIQSKGKVFTYLTFRLNNEVFAANVEQALTILELKPITKVPNSPEYMRGVINLRGNVLPVIDMRAKFGMPATEFTQETCIIVLNVSIEDEDVQLGILVDAVSEVLEINEKEIEPSPSIGTKYKVEFIKGMYRLEQGFIMLLDIDLIFNTEELLIAKEIEVGSVLENPTHEE